MRNSPVNKSILTKDLLKIKKFWEKYRFKNDLPKGQIIKKDNILMKKPAIGFKFDEIDKVIGKTAKKNISSKELLEEANIVNGKKICVIINNRANYGRVKSLLQQLKNIKIKTSINFRVIIILSRFGSVNEVIKKDGFRADEIIYTVIEGENPTTMAKSGLAVIELTTIFGKLKPDIVLTIIDRYETLPIAIAVIYEYTPRSHKVEK